MKTAHYAPFFIPTLFKAFQPNEYTLQVHSIPYHLLEYSRATIRTLHTCQSTFYFVVSNDVSCNCSVAINAPNNITEDTNKHIPKPNCR